MDLTWYNTLNKPAFTPPSDVFAPAWTILYLMIFSSFMIFITTKTTQDKTSGIGLFLVQLLLNFLWSPVFFYWKNITLSFVIIILLLGFLLMTIINFYKISKWSAILLIPYFAWICYATYLNYGFMMMNWETIFI